MNALQLFTRLRDSLKALNYNSTSQPIFGNNGVHVVVELPTFQLSTWSAPCCFLVHGGAKPYLQNPSLFEQFISLTYFVENHGSEFGEGVMLGRNENATTKAGKGVFEIEAEIINHMLSLTALSGSKVTFTLLNSTPPKTVSGNFPSLKKTLMFSAIIDMADDNAQGDEDNILRMPGKLYWNPVNLTDNFGTLLGYKNQEMLFETDLEAAIRNVPGDETAGREFAHSIFTGANPYVIFTMLEYSSATMALCFPSMEDSGDVKGYDTKTGDDFAGDSGIFGRLLFVPDDTTNNKILLLQKVVPTVVKPLGISRNGNTEYVVKLQCFRKTTNADGVFFLGDIANAILR